MSSIVLLTFVKTGLYIRSMTLRARVQDNARRPRPLPGRPDTWNWWLRGVMTAFYDERLTWDLARDAESKGYPTEAAEYAARFPCPQLRTFLIDQSHKREAVAA